MVIGTDGSNDGFIRSANMPDLTPTGAEQGFYLSQDGQIVVGDATNYMKWNGTGLDIIGDLGGSIGQIDIGSPTTNGIRISSNGILAYKNSNLTFSLNTSGDAFFKGVIEAGSGTIGGVTFSEGTIGGAAALTLPRLIIQNNLTLESLASATFPNGATFANTVVARSIVPSSSGAFDLGTTTGVILRWRNIFLVNAPNTSSDIRLKENVQEVQDEYNDIILNTEIITYNHIGDDSPQIGINANAFAEQFGDKSKLVAIQDDSGYYGANYTAFVPMLIKTVQSQHAEIESLKNRLTILEGNGS